MNFFIKIISFIKNVFNKQEKVKKLEVSKQGLNKKEEVDFIKSLRATTAGKRKKKEVEILICEGNGLGIQKRITY